MKKHKKKKIFPILLILFLVLFSILNDNISGEGYSFKTILVIFMFFLLLFESLFIKND